MINQPEIFSHFLDNFHSLNHQVQWRCTKVVVLYQEWLMHGQPSNKSNILTFYHGLYLPHQEFSFLIMQGMGCFFTVSRWFFFAFLGQIVICYDSWVLLVGLFDRLFMLFPSIFPVFVFANCWWTLTDGWLGREANPPLVPEPPTLKIWKSIRIRKLKQHNS